MGGGGRVNSPLGTPFRADSNELLFVLMALTLMEIRSWRSAHGDPLMEIRSWRSQWIVIVPDHA